MRPELGAAATASDGYTAPIALIAFDRPEYLDKVLQSLVRQQGLDLAQRECWLFQDGSINPFSRRINGAQTKIDASISLFRHYLPHGLVFDAPHNLGVALNFDRAECYAFEERGFEACIFLEDDMELGPHYIRTLDNMVALAVSDPRLGYVAAFGHHLTPIKEQLRAPNRLIPLGINWAFGLTRQQWQRNRPYVDQYLALVREVDYRLRDHLPIYDLYSSWGMERAFSSQDRAKTIACCLTGGLRVNTLACQGKYIGRVGIHSREDAYVRGRYEATELYTEGPLSFGAVSDVEYTQLLKTQTQTVIAKTPVLRPGVPLSLAKGGNGVGALRSGFYGPDGSGAWAAACVAQFTVQLASPAPQPGAALTMLARHGLPDGASAVPVCVSCNGTACGSIYLGAEPLQTAITLPHEMLRPAELLTIRLDSGAIGRRADGAPVGVGIAELGLRLA